MDTGQTHLIFIFYNHFLTVSDSVKCSGVIYKQRIPFEMQFLSQLYVYMIITDYMMAGYRDKFVDILMQ